MSGEAVQQTLLELWTSRLSCDHWTHPIGAGGVPYGRAPEGSWMTCYRCQGQRKVIETIPFDDLAHAGLLAELAAERSRRYARWSAAPRIRGIDLDNPSAGAR